MDPETGRNASVKDPSTWGAFKRAFARHKCDGLDGIGIVLVNDDELLGIDLDNCRDPESGEIAAWALEIVEAVDSYTEVSPSGSGLRILLFGSLPPQGRRKDNIEMYDSGRYLTVTGHVLEGRDRIEARHDAVLGLHRKVFGEKGPTRRKARPTEPGDAPALKAEQATPCPDLLDDRVESLRARLGHRFTDLFDGGRWEADYPSQSEADLALVGMMVRGGVEESATLDALFRRSALMRDKWDERRGTLSYGDRTIDHAVCNQQDQFDLLEKFGIDEVERIEIPDEPDETRYRLRIRGRWSGEFSPRKLTSQEAVEGAFLATIGDRLPKRFQALEGKEKAVKWGKLVEAVLAVAVVKVLPKDASIKEAISQVILEHLEGAEPWNPERDPETASFPLRAPYPADGPVHAWIRLDKLVEQVRMHIPEATRPDIVKVLKDRFHAIDQNKPRLPTSSRGETLTRVPTRCRVWLIPVANAEEVAE